MKANVEINYVGRVFINYWDWRNGNDVVCELIDGKLIHSHEVDGENKKEEITLSEFIKMIENLIN